MGFSGGGGAVVQPATWNQGSGGITLQDVTGSGIVVETAPGSSFVELGATSILIANAAGSPFGAAHGISVIDQTTTNVIIGLAYDTSVFASGGCIYWEDANGVHKGALYAGTGVPNNAGGVNGDFALRSDSPGVANTRLYVKSAGAWVGIV